MNKAAVIIVILIGSCFIAEKGSIWFGNTFIYTQDMRDAEAAAISYNKAMLEISVGTRKAEEQLRTYGMH